MIILACNFKHEEEAILELLSKIIVASSISKLFWSDEEGKFFVFESHLTTGEIKEKVESSKKLAEALQWLIVIDARSFKGLSTMGITSEKILKAWLEP